MTEQLFPDPYDDIPDPSTTDVPDELDPRQAPVVDVEPEVEPDDPAPEPDPAAAIEDFEPTDPDLEVATELD